MQTSAFDYLRHGQTPFFRLPVAPVVVGIRARTRAVLVGVPTTAARPTGRERSRWWSARRRARSSAQGTR